MPITITTLCISSMPAEEDATDENKSQSLSTWSSRTSTFSSPSALATPSAEAPRNTHRRIAAVVTVLRPRAAPPDALAGEQRTLDLHEMHVARIVDSGVAHGQMHRLNGLLDLRLAADSSGRKSRVCAMPMLSRLPLFAFGRSPSHPSRCARTPSNAEIARLRAAGHDESDLVLDRSRRQL